MSHDSTSRLRAVCLEVGFDLDHAKASIVDRMRLLSEHTETFDDASRMAMFAHDVFRYYAERKPERAFSALEQRTVVLGCLFSDVGKTGPERANAAERRLVAEMFSIENVDDDGQSVSEFLHSYFPADAVARIARFEGLGLDPAMTIRQFWNLHSGWSLAIAETAGLPLEAVAAAATHHLLDDVNPHAIVGEDGRFTREFGDNDRFDRSEKLVILLDKYDAIRRRGRRSHEEAIAWLRARIAKTPRFCDDPELAGLIDDLDEALRRHVELG